MALAQEQNPCAGGTSNRNIGFGLSAWVAAY
jgi:hypothetical protein